MEKRNKVILGILIFVIPFVIYAGSFNNQFLAGDDEEIVLRNVYLRSWKYIPNIFAENYKAGAGGITDFWRPFQILTYAFIINTVGMKVWAFHFASILFHALCGLFLYLIFMELFRPRGKIYFPVIAAVVLLWTVHPIHNEELAVTTGLASPTHLFWMLSGLLTFIHFEKTKKRGWIALSLASYALALCSKESGIVFPGLLLGMHLAGMKEGVFDKVKIKQIILKHAPFWGMALLYVIARLTVLNFKNTLNFYGQPNVFTENFSYRIYTFFTVLVHGLKIMIFPAGLHPERSWPVFTSLFTPQVMISFIIVAAIFVSALIMWKKRPIFTFGIFFFLFSYMPMSNLFAQINALIWDHWFYTPSVGIFLGIAALLDKRSAQKIAAFAMIPIILTFGSITAYRNHFFRNTESVSKYILSYEPKTVKTWNNLGMALAEKGKTEEAIACYLRSINLADVYPQTHHNLAMIYMDMGKYELAEREYTKALSIDSNFYYSYIWLGKLYLRQDKKDEAAACFKKALEIYPHLPAVREYLSRIER